MPTLDNPELKRPSIFTSNCCHPLRFVFIQFAPEKTAVIAFFNVTLQSHYRVPFALQSWQFTAFNVLTNARVGNVPPQTVVVLSMPARIKRDPLACISVQSSLFNRILDMSLIPFFPLLHRAGLIHFPARSLFSFALIR